MKKQINKAKRDTAWVGYGARRGIRALITWINAPSDKLIVKRRLVITTVIPLGVILLAIEHPAIGVPVPFALFLLATAWFGHVDAREMTTNSADYGQPYNINGRIIHGADILHWLVDSYPGESLHQLTQHLAYELDGPNLTPEQLGRQLVIHDVFHPEAAHHSPAKIAAAEPGQADTEEAGEGNQGSGPSGSPSRTEEPVSRTGFRNRMMSYAGSSLIKKEIPGEPNGEQSPEEDGYGRGTTAQGSGGMADTEREQQPSIPGPGDHADRHGEGSAEPVRGSLRQEPEPDRGVPSAPSERLPEPAPSGALA